MTDAATDNSKFCLIKIKGKYAQVSPDGQSIAMLDSTEGATVFPPEIATQLIQALQAHGVEDEIEMEEVQPQG